MVCTLSVHVPLEDQMRVLQNTLKDIQDHHERFRSEVRAMYLNLHQRILKIEPDLVASDSLNFDFPTSGPEKVFQPWIWELVQGGDDEFSTNEVASEALVTPVASMEPDGEETNVEDVKDSPGNSSDDAAADRSTITACLARCDELSTNEVASEALVTQVASMEPDGEETNVENVKDSTGNTSDDAAADVSTITECPARCAEMSQCCDGRPWSNSDFSRIVTIGTGTFGRVLLVKSDKLENTPLALKIMKKSEIIRLKQVEHVKSEKDILLKVSHPFIVSLLVAFQDETCLYMVMEYVNGGELFSHLRKVGRLRNEHGRFYAAQIVLVFEHLHSLLIAYRDLKPENILLDNGGNIKLADFGFAKIIDGHTMTLCGTPEYLAPELIQSKGHDCAVDWWALGILIFEMLAGQPPFYDERAFGIYQKVLTGNIDYPMSIDLRAKDIIRKFLVHDRSKRLGSTSEGAREVKKHKWFNGLDWDRVLAREVTAPFIPPVKSADDTAMFDQYPESSGEAFPPLTDQDNANFLDF